MFLFVLHLPKGYPLTRKKRSLFEPDGDLDAETNKWMTWSADKNPEDFKDWSVDSKGNYFMDIPLKSTEKVFDMTVISNQVI